MPAAARRLPVEWEVGKIQARAFLRSSRGEPPRRGLPPRLEGKVRACDGTGSRHGGATAPVPVDEVVDGDLTILGSFSYTSSAWGDVVALLNAGRFRPRFLVTHRFPLEAWEEAIATLRGTEGPRGKVVLTLPEPEA